MSNHSIRIDEETLEMLQDIKRVDSVSHKSRLKSLIRKEHSKMIKGRDKDEHSKIPN